MADISDGFILLYRKLLDNPILLRAELLQLFIYCLLKANHKENEFIWNDKMIKVKKGEFITGRFQIAKDLRQKDVSVYKRLKILQKLGYITLKSNNKYTLLSIVNYSSYQISKEQREQQRNNKVTTKEQQSNTNNNDNKENNDNKRESIEKPTLSDIILYFQELKSNETEAKKYYDYYSTNNWHTKAGQQIKDFKASVRNWINKDKKESKDSTDVEVMAFDILEKRKNKLFQSYNLCIENKCYTPISEIAGGIIGKLPDKKGFDFIQLRNRLEIKIKEYLKEQKKKLSTKDYL